MYETVLLRRAFNENKRRKCVMALRVTAEDEWQLALMRRVLSGRPLDPDLPPLWFDLLDQMHGQGDPQGNVIFDADARARET